MYILSPSTIHADADARHPPEEQENIQITSTLSNIT